MKKKIEIIAKCIEWKTTRVFIIEEGTEAEPDHKPNANATFSRAPKVQCSGHY